MLNGSHPGKTAGFGEALAATQRYAPVVRQALEADLAEAVLRDKAWPALAMALRAAEHAGTEPVRLLQQVAGERELGSAKYPAQVLNLRLTHRDATAADVVANSFPVPIGHAAISASAEKSKPLTDTQRLTAN